MGEQRGGSRRRWGIIEWGALAAVVATALALADHLGAFSAKTPSKTTPVQRSTPPAAASRPPAGVSPAHGSAARLTDLPVVSDEGGSDSSPGPAVVGGQPVVDALLVPKPYSGVRELDLSLDGKYRNLDATVGQMTSESDVPGDPMHIQILVDTQPSPLLDRSVKPGDPPFRKRRNPLGHAQTLKIVVADQNGSAYDEAVVAGVVTP